MKSLRHVAARSHVRALVSLALPLALTSSALAQGIPVQAWVDFTEAPSLLVDSPATPFQLASLGEVISMPQCARFDQSEADLREVDLDKDGREDVIVVRKAPGYCDHPTDRRYLKRKHVLLMNVNGELVDSTAQLAPQFLSNPSHARDVITGDVNGDGWTDVIIGNTFGQDPELYVNGRRDSAGNWRGLIRVANWFETANMNSSFEDPSELASGQTGLPGMTTCAIALLDIDDDRDFDLYIGNYPLGGFEFSRDRFLVNDGTGFFSEDPSRIASMGAFVQDGVLTSGVEAADVNNDGLPDITIVQPFQGIRVAYNDGIDSVGSASLVPTGPASAVYMHTVGDMNGDGMIDIYNVADFCDSTIVNLGGSSTGGPVGWNPEVIIDPTVLTSNCSMTNGGVSTSGLGGNAKAYDFDGDGRDEIGLCDLETDNLVQTGGCPLGGGRFTLLQGLDELLGGPAAVDPYALTPRSFNVPGVWDFCAPDVDGDGKRDLVMSTCTGMRVFIQN